METKSTIRPRQLRRWFLGGFAMIFVGMLLLFNQYFYTGEVVVRCKLWKFYLLEIRRGLTSSNLLGPTTGAGDQAIVLFLQHLGIACIGGLVSLGIGAFITRSRTS